LNMEYCTLTSSLRPSLLSRAARQARLADAGDLS
jgi:hypothetical protein